MKNIKISVNKKAGFPINGETLEIMTLEDAFEYQSQLSSGKEKSEYGGIYSFKNGIKLEKGKDDSIYENDGILFIDVDHIYDSFADRVFDDFEDLFQNIHGIIGVCYSSSHNLHFFAYTDKHLTPEIYKEEAINATKIISWVLWNRYGSTIGFEEFTRKIYDGRKNKGKEFEIGHVFDLHNTNPYQSFFFCPGNTKTLDSGAIGDNEFLNEILDEVNISIKNTSKDRIITHRNCRYSCEANIPENPDKLCIDRNFVVEGLSGNDLRMGICSWLVKYFGEEKAKEYIQEKFSNYKDFSINSKTANYDYRKIKSWVFENLEIFEQVKQNNFEIKRNDRVNLYDYLFTDELKSLIDENIEMTQDQYISRYLSVDLFKEKGSKLIISAKCGTGKTHFMREYKGWCEINRPEENIYILCPYGSVQRQYWKDNVVNYNIFSLTDKAEKKINLKPGDTVFIDEIHTALSDSTFRYEETQEYEKLINRDDINICFFTATPTIGLIRGLKEKGFKYINLDKNIIKRVGLINIEFLKRRYIDSIFTGIKQIIQKFESKYTGIIICCNSVRSDKAYSLGLNTGDIITADNYRMAKMEDWETPEDDNKMRQDIRDFVSGETSWSGIKWGTRYIYAGIDNQIEHQKILFITLNSEINILDLIQLSNRCRKSEIDIINIIDDDYRKNKSSMMNSVFNDAYYLQEEYNCKNPICNIGRTIILDDNNKEFSGVMKLKNIGIIDRCKIRNNNDGTFTIPGDSIISIDSEDDLYKLWERYPEIQNQPVFNNNFASFRETIKNRGLFFGDPKGDKLYKKVIMKEDKIKEDIESIRNYLYSNGDFNDRISKISGNNYGVFDWSAIDIDTTIEKNVENLGKNLLNDNRFFVSEKIRKDITPETITTITYSIIRNSYYVKKELTRGKELLKNIKWKIKTKDFEEDEKNNFRSLKIYLTQIYDKTECSSYVNGDEDKYFNDQDIVIEDGIEKVAPKHNEKKKGGNIKKRYILITNNHVIFYNLKECYDYLIKEGIVKCTESTFKLKKWKEYFLLEK